MHKEDLNTDFILLNIGYAIHNADWNWKNVHSPFARIHYIVNGDAKIIRDGDEHSLTKGHLYLTPPYVRHSYVCNDALELYYIHIYEDTGRNISFFDTMNLPFEIKASDIDITLIKRLVKTNPGLELKHYDPCSYDNSSNLTKNIIEQKDISLSSELETQGAVKVLFSHFVAQASHKNWNIDTRILKSLYHIHKHLDSSIRIEALAEMCFMSKDHYIRLFKKGMKTTPRKYINQKKIEQIQLAILLNDKPIKDIAYDFGFDNIPYFNRLFKKTTGESPREFRLL
ncbi:MAG: AraC family transcriptional regulator [Bacteroidales bacterium]